jgi:recombination protein RecA
MTKPFDVSRFRKSITKSIDGLSTGFHDPKDWISTGNYALNYLISGDFHKGVPLGKVTIFAGESGAGKSYIASGNIVKDAQAQGIYVVLIDSENALDETWLHALGVDTDESKLLKLSMSMIDDVALTISTFMKDYKAMDEADRPKVLFIVDSLGMLLTPTDVKQFEAGDMKGDMGRKPKALTALVRNTVNMFGAYNVGLVATNHTYESQDMFNPDEVISGGRGFIFASSIVVAMKKMKLKEDEDGNKTSTVNGIRAGCKIMKTRYAKPFENIQIKIPYTSGMSPYSGMFEMAEAKGMLVKSGNSYVYTTKAGEELKAFRKKWEANENGLLDKVMADMAMSDLTDYMLVDAADDIDQVLDGIAAAEANPAIAKDEINQTEDAPGHNVSDVADNAQ